MTTHISHLVRHDAARTLLDGPLGAALLADAEATRGGTAVVVHTLAPRSLGAPVHTHAREDELSYVLAGQVGFEVAGTVEVARPGDLVVKPRDVPHAFWNAGDEPARILEIITPGGFTDYFEQLADVLAAPGGPDPVALGGLAASHEVAMDPGSIGRLAREHGLVVA